MGIFDERLGANESLIVNEGVLERDYVPKLLPFRDGEQKHLATCIAPLMQNRSARNLFIYGPPGIGKTAGARHVLRELENTSDSVHAIYINCWQHNSTFKVYSAICEELGYRLTHNKKTIDLFKVIAKILNESAAVFVFDEIDKAEDFDFLYTILEQIYRKSVITITNYKSFLLELDERIKSRFTPEMLEFRQYTHEETASILQERAKLAFPPNVMDLAGLRLIVDKTAQMRDIRAGLHLLKESAKLAEDKSSRKILSEHVEAAIQKLEEFTIKNAEDLEDDTQRILVLVQTNSGLKIGDLYRKYESGGGKTGYKTFQRKLARLDQNSFITLRKQAGAGGNTTIVENVNKSLKEF